MQKKRVTIVNCLKVSQNFFEFRNAERPVACALGSQQRKIWCPEPGTSRGEFDVLTTKLTLTQRNVEKTGEVFNCLLASHL